MNSDQSLLAGTFPFGSALWILELKTWWIRNSQKEWNCMTHEKAPSTWEDLSTAIRESWNHFDELLKFFPERIKVVIKRVTKS